MNISKKLKQLMKVLLVVFMSLTVIVPNGFVKAENQYLHTDKETYDYDEPIMVGVQGYDYSSSYVWVGLYKVGDQYADGTSTRWFQVTDEQFWNILDYNKNKTVDENGGQYEVVLFGDGGFTKVVEKVSITINPKPSNPVEATVTTDKIVYKIGDPIMVTASTNVSGAWVALLKKDDAVDAQSYAWFYPNGTTENLVADGHMNGRDGITSAADLPAGEYRVDIIQDGSPYVCLTSVPIVITDKDNYVSTDKSKYDIGDPIMVTASTNVSGAWVALLKKDDAVDAQSYAWFYPNGTIENLVADGHMNGRDGITSAADLPAGEYRVDIIQDGSPYVCLASIDITIGVIIPTNFQLDYTNAMSNPVDNNRKRTFKYGQELTLEYSSPTVDQDAWIGLYPYDGELADLTSISYFYLKDYESPVDFFADTNAALVPPGHYRFIMFENDGYTIAHNSETGALCIMSFYVIETYYEDAEHIDWTLSDDLTTATAVFHRMDDEEMTKSFTTTAVEKKGHINPTCTEPGYDVYEAVLTFTDDNKLVTPSDTMSFTGEIKVQTEDPLEHAWGDLIVDVEPTEETEGSGHRICIRCGIESPTEVIPVIGHVHSMTHVEAKAPTCTELGNVEHYHCDGCGNNYADEAGETIIVDVTIAALGHDYGERTFDEEKHNHYRVCSRCGDKVEEECTFKNEIVGGSVVHTCSVCGGSYEDKFFWVDKTEFKQFEPIICHVDLSVISGYAGLNTNTAWIGMYEAGAAPAANISIRWHYVKNMGTPEEGFDMLTKIYGDEEGGSGTTNGYDWLLNQAGNLELYLLADGGYDKRVAHLTITLTEETLACGDIAFEFDGKDPAEEEKFEYTVPLEKDVQFKATVDGDPYGSWFGIYEGEYEKDYNFSSLTANKFWYLRDVDGAVSVNDYISKPGKYTMVVYATGGYEDMREFFWVEVTKEIAKEEVTIEPTCTEAGSKLITYTDGTTENVPIPALGHDWGEWVYDGEEAKTHTRTCKNDPSHKETVNCEFDEGVVDGDVTTYTCKECGGQYTYTRVASDAPLFRASGDNRYLTALTAADVFMEKTHKSELDTVVLACGSNFADALAGSYLAAVKNAPIILIDDNNKAATVEKYLKEHVAKGGLIYILGGDKAVAPKFESNLEKAGFTVKRLAGSNRYGTNLEILKEAGIQGNAILVSTGTNFADSLSASASGLPVLLVKDKLTAEQKDFLSNYNDKKIYILGGTNAVNKTVEGELGEYGTIKRLNGANRYETSVKIAEEFLKDADTLVIAVGDNFPDGLCGGALAYQIGAPVILVKDGRADYAKKLVEKKHIEKGVVLGGTNALKDTLINEIFGRDPKTPVEVYVKK